MFIYDGTPTHRRADNPGENTELKILPPYSPFLSIVEQAISSLKVAIKTDIFRHEIQAQMYNQAEARLQGIALGEYLQQLLLRACERNVGRITAYKCAQWHRLMLTY